MRAGVGAECIRELECSPFLLLGSGVPISDGFLSDTALGVRIPPFLPLICRLGGRIADCELTVDAVDAVEGLRYAALPTVAVFESVLTGLEGGGRRVEVGSAARSINVFRGGGCSADVCRLGGGSGTVHSSVSPGAMRSSCASM